MANHKSAKKRIKANDKRRITNRYQAKSTRTKVKQLKQITKKEEAVLLMKDVTSMIDKLAKKKVVHWKKAANQKSKLARHVNTLK